MISSMTVFGRGDEEKQKWFQTCLLLEGMVNSHTSSSSDNGQQSMVGFTLDPDIMGAGIDKTLLVDDTQRTNSP
ncbi:hypothetical protein ANO14919_084170 [Xylariales sp. No.14919]|nr:hypothetical protein ANO14919_084170 [Xylariales sp. No.14919]